MRSEVREPSAELVVDAAAPMGPAISPDGGQVAWAVASRSAGAPPRSALWIRAADGGSPARQVTSGTPRDGFPRWAPDSRSLYFSRDRDEPGEPQLHRLRLDGSQPEALTAWPGGISDHLPLADGRTVALVAQDEPTGPAARRAAEGNGVRVWGEAAGHSRLFLLDLADAAMRRIDGLGDRHVVEVGQRPDGAVLAVVTWSHPDIDYGANAAELHVVDTASGTVRHLGRVGYEAASPVWWKTPDGAWHLAYLAMTPPTTIGGLKVFDVTVPTDDEAGAAVEHHDLTAGMTACPSELVQVADGPPLALFADGLDTVVHRLDPESLRFRLLAEPPHLLRSLSADRGGRTLAAVACTAHEPFDVVAGRLPGGLVRLSDVRPELRAITWGVQQRLHYKASDGLELDGLLIWPAGRDREDGPFPLVTLVHGGPYDRHADGFSLNPVLSGQWFATAGYAVFLANPRGGSGHGHDFAAAVAGDAGGAEWTDVLTGVDLLIAEGVADPGRLALAGWSHGGFLTAWALGHTERFQAALIGAGISDWGMLAATGEAGALETHLINGAGWEDPWPVAHHRSDPIAYASRIRTPVLIVHGEDDTNVPVGQAVHLHRVLRAFGVEHEFVVYPGEGHLIGARAHQIDLLRRSRAWFDRWLGAPDPR